MPGHQYRNLKFFSYDSQLAMESSKAGASTLNDWNRQIKAGEDCIYFINGIKLSTLQKKEFADVAELKQFFKEHIFKNMPELKTGPSSRSPVMRKKLSTAASPDEVAENRPKKTRSRMSSEERANLAAEQACLHWHQAGIQHATYQHANKYTLENFPRIGLPEPKSIVNFDTVQGGVKITEENTIKAWNENDPKGGRPKKHIRGEKEPYYVKMHTSYLFTPDTIQVQDLVIDCPSKALAPIFDTRPKNEQGARGNTFMRSLYSFVSGFSSKTPPQAPLEDNEQTTTIALPKPNGR